MPVADGPLRVARDGALSRAEFERLEAELRSRSDHGRIFVVIAAAGRAQKHLPRSIPRLLEQLSALHIGADLLLGCNSGFEPGSVLDVLKHNTAVQLVNARCTKEKPAEPAPILAEDGRPLELAPIAGGRHRVVVVRQAATPAARGKIRMLSDLYGWIANAIASGQAMPAYLLQCDSESEFNALDPLLSHGADEPRLAKLIRRLDADSVLQVVGARARIVAFRETPSGILEPAPSLPIRRYLAANLVAARWPGFDSPQGAGMLGRTAAMVAVYSTVARLYPYTQADDAYAVALFAAAGLQSATEPGVAVINYCPRREDTAGVAAQFDRWVGGVKEIEAAYGRELTERLWTTALGPTIVIVLRLWFRDWLRAPSFRDRWKVGLCGLQLLTLIRANGHVWSQARVQRGDDPAAVSDWT